MKFAIVSDLHHGPEMVFDGVTQTLSRHTLSFVRNTFIPSVLNQNAAFVIQLGDAISGTGNINEDTHLWSEISSILGEAHVPVHHVVGNHESKYFSISKLQSLLRRDSLYYSFNHYETHFVILHSQQTFPNHYPDTEVFVNQVQLDWLAADLEINPHPAYVFIHHPLVNQDFAYNYWFHGQPQCAVVSNRHDVRSILEGSGNVVAIFNGHTHWDTMDTIHNIQYITVCSPVEHVGDGNISSAFHIIEI